jgi:hypothetical protein
MIGVANATHKVCVALVADLSNYLHPIRLVCEQLTTQMYCDTDQPGALHCNKYIALSGCLPARG